MLDAAQLRASFDLAPADAIAYFRSKGYKTTDNWWELWQDAHAKAFTVARGVRLDVLEVIKAEIDTSLTEGLTDVQFQQRLAPQLKKLGWWGKQFWTDGEGKTEQVQLGSPHRLSKIYRINQHTAYAAGRYRQQLASVKFRPYWVYSALIDDRTRPGHEILHQQVFKWDDPIWQYIYPPNDWECRCMVRAITEAQLKRMGLTISSGADYIQFVKAEAGVNKRTGEVIEVDHVQINLPGINGKPRVMRPGVGWAHNPGAAAFSTDVAMAKKIGDIKDITLKTQVIQSLNNSELRHAQFANWAEQVLTARRAGHSVQTLGFMDEAIFNQVAARTGLAPSRILAFNEKRLIHADSERHQNDGVALTLSEYKALPALLSTPEAVLWEAEDNALLYVFPADNGQKIKVVFRTGRRMRKQIDLIDEGVNAFKVDWSELKKPRYEVLQGEVLAP